MTAARRRCTAITRAGTPCLCHAQRGATTCFQHGPQHLRWPWEPLAQILGGSVENQATTLGVDPRQIHRWRLYGLDDPAADQCAIGLGSHPAIIWPEWHSAVIDLESMSPPLGQDGAA